MLQCPLSYASCSLQGTSKNLQGTSERNAILKGAGHSSCKLSAHNPCGRVQAALGSGVLEQNEGHIAIERWDEAT